MTYVEFNMTHTTGHASFTFFDTSAEAVAVALDSGLIESPASDVSVYCLIDADGDRRYAIQVGHDGHGVHTTAKDAVTADAWMDDDCAFTTDQKLATQ